MLTFNLVVQNPEEVVNRILKLYNAAYRVCMKAIEVCEDVDLQVLKKCLESGELEKDEEIAVQKCIEFLESTCTQPIATIRYPDGTEGEIGIALRVSKRPGMSGERALSVRVGLYIDPYGGESPVVVFVPLRLRSLRSDADKLRDFLRALAENKDVINMIGSVLSAIVEKLESSRPQTTRGRRKVRITEEMIAEVETEEVEEAEAKAKTKTTEKKAKEKKAKSKSEEEEEAEAPEEAEEEESKSKKAKKSKSGSGGQASGVTFRTADQLLEEEQKKGSEGKS